MSKKINIIINGFGRIGRAVFRNCIYQKNINILGINDINDDEDNLVYIYNFDKLVQVYKKFPPIVKKKKKLTIIKKKFQFYNFINIHNFSKVKNLDFIIDCSGVTTNSADWKKLSLINKNLKILFTFDHPLSELVMVIGANEHLYKDKYRFISTSICDATALAPFIKLIHNNFGVSHGHITTVHPILNYQNLLDGRAISYSTPPNTTFSDYTLGRSALDNLIPKPTTAVKVMNKSLSLTNFDPSKIKSFSYRVPTTIVGSADINLVLKKNFNINLILALIKKEIKKQKHKIFSINKTPAISSDFFLNEHSLIYDHNWSTKTKNLFHAVLWYDNENGYSARVVDQLKLISNRKKK